MPPDPVDLVLAGYAGFNAGERVPQLDFWHEDAVYEAAREDPDSDIHRGIEAVRAQFAGWCEAYPDLRVEPLDSLGHGDRVFMWVRFAGHGAGSGMPMEMQLAHVWTFRDDRAARVVEYFDRAEALRAFEAGA
jgi:ketosteroid isomerase-like protein